jgi:hypothetical protein
MMRSMGTVYPLQQQLLQFKQWQCFRECIVWIFQAQTVVTLPAVYHSGNFPLHCKCREPCYIIQTARLPTVRVYLLHLIISGPNTCWNQWDRVKSVHVTTAISQEIRCGNVQFGEHVMTPRHQSLVFSPNSVTEPKPSRINERMCNSACKIVSLNLWPNLKPF